MTACSSESGSLCRCGSSLASDIQSGLTSEGTFYKNWDSLTKVWRLQDCHSATLFRAQFLRSMRLWGWWKGGFQVATSWHSRGCQLPGTVHTGPCRLSGKGHSLIHDCWETTDLEGPVELCPSAVLSKNMRETERAAEPKPLARLASPSHTWQVGRIWGP